MEKPVNHLDIMDIRNCSFSNKTSSFKKLLVLRDLRVYKDSFDFIHIKKVFFRMCCSKLRNVVKVRVYVYMYIEFIKFLHNMTQHFLPRPQEWIVDANVCSPPFDHVDEVWVYILAFHRLYCPDRFCCRTWSISHRKL